jgi:hypothetical protein
MRAIGEDCLFAGLWCISAVAVPSTCVKLAINASYLPLTPTKTGSAMYSPHKYPERETNAAGQGSLRTAAAVAPAFVVAPAHAVATQTTHAQGACGHVVQSCNKAGGSCKPCAVLHHPRYLSITSHETTILIVIRMGYFFCIHCGHLAMHCGWVAR